MKTLGSECESIYENIKNSLDGVDEERKKAVLSGFKFVVNQFHETLSCANAYERLLIKNGISPIKTFPQCLYYIEEFEKEYKEEWDWLYDHEAE